MSKVARAKYIVRVLSGSLKETVRAGKISFEPDVSDTDADAVLSMGSGSEQLLDYDGVKGWWAHEALSHSVYQIAAAKRLVRELSLAEWFHFANPDPRFAVPVYTHIHGYIETGEGNRIPKALAVVSNTGGRWWWAKPGIRRRNRMIINEYVDLMGSGPNWSRYRRFGPLSPAACPANYAGELAGANMCMPTIKGMARYKAVVCMENSAEPLYFTEKFVSAVQAGAIPIYHAHQTVRDGILQGARWIDPESYGFDAEATLKAALGANRADFAEQNSAWFRSEAVVRTRYEKVWERVAEIMEYRILNPDDGADCPRVSEAVRMKRRILF